MDNILVKIREARMFEFLAVQPSVNETAVKICQDLIHQIKRNGAQQQPWTTINEVAKNLQNHGYVTNSSQIQRVVDALSRHGIMIQQGEKIAFCISMLPSSYFFNKSSRKIKPTSEDSQSSPKSSLSNSDYSFNRQAKMIKSMASSVPDFSAVEEASKTPVQQDSVSNSDKSAESSGGSSSLNSVDSKSIDTSLDHSDTPSSSSENEDEPSPLSSYFSSVNTILTKQRRQAAISSSSDDKVDSDSGTKSSNSSSSFDEGESRIDSNHVISRNVKVPYTSLVSGDSVKSEVSQSALSNKINFADSIGGSQSNSSSVSSETSQSSLQKMNPSNSSSQMSEPLSHDYVKDVQKIYNGVHFISLISDHSKIGKIAQQEFRLVVSAREEKGIRESDRLFKYEFKMNYRKFGKVGNQINNQLMNLVSHPK